MFSTEYKNQIENVFCRGTKMLTFQASPRRYGVFTKDRVTGNTDESHVPPTSGEGRAGARGVSIKIRKLVGLL
jgi:hypothetical protein